MASYPFHHVGVFSQKFMSGNSVAVVHDAYPLDEQAMKAIARWVGLPMTAFILPAQLEGADFRIRIFNEQAQEQPFAGSPTLGACGAWLDAKGQEPLTRQITVQSGGHTVLVQPIGDKMGDKRYAFCVPPLLRSPVAKADQQLICKELSIDAKHIVASQMLNNGHRFFAFLLDDVQTLQDLQPHLVRLLESKMNVGLIAPRAAKEMAVSDACDYEAWSFLYAHGVQEDFVSGGLHAAIAQWFMEEKLAPSNYSVLQKVSQETDHRRLYVQQDASGAVWLGGDVNIGSAGHLDYPAAAGSEVQ